MFRIIQSNSSQKLAEVLVGYYAQSPAAIFEPFLAVVPAKVLSEWLSKKMADTLGISALFEVQFWGQYQWQLIERVLTLEAHNLALLGRDDEAMFVPKEALLSQSVLRWRLFSYLSQEGQACLDDPSHPLHTLLQTASNVLPTAPNAPKQYQLQRQALWQLCGNIARLFVAYLTERPDWLTAWSGNRFVDVLALLKAKDSFGVQYGADPTPDWLAQHYVQTETAFCFLWHKLFGTTYRQRLGFEDRFWRLIESNAHNMRTLLPKTLYLFTVLELPKTQLDFLKRLSLYCDVVLLHFNPCMLFWADIVDKNWLLQQKLVAPERVYLKEHGHTLLSRLGKASRTTFAMLVHLSGNEDKNDNNQGFEAVWQDAFDELLEAPKTLLNDLKKDILLLEENPLERRLDDDSIAIHVCHSLKRQLEVARLMIGRWLNQPNADGSVRALSDVVIMLPDVAKHAALVRSVFCDTVGIDGLCLPAKVVGVPSDEVNRLLASVLGLFELTLGRFYYQDFCAWLMLAPVHEGVGLHSEQARRACELLSEAGFVQGFDDKHLAQNLHEQDTDYRYSFVYALDRLCAGVLMGGDFCALGQGTIVQAGVSAEDALVIQALCVLHQKLVPKYPKDSERTVVDWVLFLEQNIEAMFYHLKGSDALKSVFSALYGLKKTAQAHTQMPMQLPLSFVLSALSEALQNQQVASEPSGVISVGRFGSLRGMGFGLVVLIGMDLDAFGQGRSNPLDLRQAGLARLGDRIKDDDEKGAFLEALFQASQAFWVFYRGQRYDGQSLAPAAFVSEFEQFLLRHGTDDNIKAVIYHHSPLPFVPSASAIPPVWQNVYQNLHTNQPRPTGVPLPNASMIDEVLNNVMDEACCNQILMGKTLSLRRVAAVLKDPAKAYLNQHLHVVIYEDEQKEMPLSLDGLGAYRLSDELLHQSDTSMLIKDTLLPVGVASLTSLTASQEAYRAQNASFEKQSLEQFSKTLTPCVLKTRHIRLDLQGGDCVLLADLPEPNQVLARLLPAKMSEKLMGEAYLHHLAWQLWCQSEGVDSLWVGSDQSGVAFGALPKQEAALYLKRLLALSLYCQELPIVLGFELAIAYLTKEEKGVYGLWQQKGYDYVSPSSCHHVFWQTILGDADPNSALCDALALAVIYEPILKDLRENANAK